MMRSTKVKLQKVDCYWIRFALFLFGWINVLLGTIGVFVPGLTTTKFFLFALLAFSRSSIRFYSWIWNHPLFVGSIRNWHEHWVILVKAKFLAMFMMSGSFLYLTFSIAENWLFPTLMAAFMLPSRLYVFTRNSQVRWL